MDIATFRAALPEFSSTVTYPDAMITLWLGFGVARLNADVWLDLLDQGLLYFIAHNIALAARRVKASAVGGAPGLTQGTLASKAVDKVSAGYDTASVAVEGGGLWNQTEYGIMFLQLSRLVGAQGIHQTGGSPNGVNTGVFGNGYIN